MAENDIETLAAKLEAQAVRMENYTAWTVNDGDIECEDMQGAALVREAAKALTALRNTTAEPVGDAPVVAVVGKHHFPDGPYLQPDGLYVGFCRCGHRYEGRDGGEAELDWLKHLALTDPTDSAAKDAEIARLREHIRFQADHVENRIKDGMEMGAAVWRIALEDVVAENRSFLAALANRGEAGALAKEREE